MEVYFCACRDDCEYCTIEDYFKEESAEQNWEYLADGTFYRQTAQLYILATGESEP